MSKVDFWTRIEELRKKNGGLTQTKLGKLIGVSQSSISQWKDKGILPNSQALFNIADEFDVSLDWLVGRTECTNIQENKDFERGTYARIIDDLLILYACGSVKAFSGDPSIDECDGFSPQMMVIHDPLLSNMLIQLYSKHITSPDIEFPELKKKLKEQFTDVKLLTGDIEKMKNLSYEELQKRGGSYLNVDLEKLYQALKDIE